jgi:hypothetical protein
VLTQEVEGETVLLDMDKGHYYVLDDVGTRIWQLLEDHGDVERVVEGMLAEFDVDESTLRADIETLMEKLTESGLLVTDPPE